MFSTNEMADFPPGTGISCADSIADSEASGQIPPSSTLQSRRRPLETGFECEFIDKPRELQFDCPICLHILREPHQATCCGNSFCWACIERVKEQNKPCPTCNEQGFGVFHDKRLQQRLYDFIVVCTHRDAGCEWRGELRQLEKHLNSDPSPEKQLDGCVYESVACVYCHAPYARKEIQQHQGSKCGKRPFSCEYCANYESTCDDVMDNHWPVCPSRPVPCPNNCGVYPERQNLKAHMSNECTKQKVKCPFTYAGCYATPHPNDLQHHMDSNVSNHLFLLASFSQKLIDVTTGLSQKVGELEKQVQRGAEPQSKAHYGFPADKESAPRAVVTEQQQQQTYSVSASSEIIDLMRQVDHLKLLCKNSDQVVKEQSEKIKGLEQRNQMLNEKVEKLLCQPKIEGTDSIQELRSHLCIVPSVYTISDYTIRLSQSDLWFKPHPFYTHPQGYRMQLSVSIHGDGAGKGTHMSVFLSLMKGEFDNQLKWPFRGSVTIQLLNQQADTEHYTECITYGGAPDQVADRVMDERRLAKSWGKMKFIAHESVLPKFVKDDSLKLCILKVKM